MNKEKNMEIMYTEEELFNLPNLVIADPTEIYRFNCTLLVTSHGYEEIVGKRIFYPNQLRGQGYIGFDAYNHCVDPKITDRIRITYIGKDFLIIFLRTPEKGNEPKMYKVTFENNGIKFVKDCGNGVIYTLITTIKKQD
jgi:hypothetical protein